MKLLVFASLAFVFSQAQALSMEAASSPKILSCSVSGPQVQPGQSVTDKWVSTVASSMVPVVLGENVDFGTYNTYVHVNLSYNPGKNPELGLTVTTEFSELLHLQVNRNLTAEFSLKSRVHRSPMRVKITCHRVATDYALVPTGPVSKDPFYSFESTATRLDKFVQNPGIYGVGYPVASNSEFLANHFCVSGNVQKLFEQLSMIKSTPTGFWRSAPLGQGVLVPSEIKLTQDGILWKQPVQSATCTLSHTETGTNQDQEEVEYTVCDHYQINDLPALEFMIPVCK